MFIKSKYYNLNTVTIFKDRLIANLDTLKKFDSQIEIFPNLKSNAYGHGIKEIASVLKSQSSEFIVVDSIFEALQLRKVLPKQKILVTGFIDLKNSFAKYKNISFAVWDIEQLAEISQKNKDAKFHIFVDTGMNREGVKLSELSDFIEKAKQFKQNIEGVMSHFSSADESNQAKTLSQVEQFKQAIKILEDSGFNFKYKHISASSGLLRSVNSVFNSARTGLVLYGIAPFKCDRQFSPVLRLSTKIVQLKSIKSDETIGYNDTFTAKKDMTIAILPLGYNDGIDRRLSNGGVAKCKGNFCKYVGKVSMNIAAIDVTNIENPQLGDEVIIFSEKSEDQNSIQNCADLIGAIPYELLVHINPSIKRVIG